VLINDLPRYEILDEAALAELERGWRRIVSELGIEFLHPEALEVFESAGQKVEGELVRFDPDWILEQVAKAPPEFDLQARNPERTVHIGGNHMVFSAVYGCPFVREGAERRDATYDDFQNLVKLAQSFPQLDSPGGTICEPNDKPLDSRHLDMVFALLTLSDKPFMGSVTSGPNAVDTIAMAQMVFGEESIEQTPAIISLINVNSPLRYDDRMLSALLEYAKAGQATVITPFLLMGAMSPVSIAATLAQQVGEALAGIALVQTLRPGCPVVFGSFLSNTDMQSGSPSFGTPESAVGLLCTGQIARHFGLPFRTGGGLTSSQVPDAQGGYEALMTLLPTFLAGTNWVMHAAGWLEGGLTASYEKFVIDLEMLRMFAMIDEGIDTSEERFAIDAMREEGPGGMFLAADHTVAHFREWMFMSPLFRSQAYVTWQKQGSATTATLATAEWKKLLESYEDPGIDPAVDEELQDYMQRRRVEIEAAL
jgi:trimethylamine---corrinoid protein Co-methyltransferase